jgi:predicted dinucleotide-binding enzyme
MEIGTLGAGAFAQAFAKRALKAGYKVKLSNSRGPDEKLSIDLVLEQWLPPRKRPNLEADPVVNGARRVAFISADDDGAKKRVETLLEGFGYSVIDLGNLRDGGLIQQAGGPLAGRDFLERGE